MNIQDYVNTFHENNRDAVVAQIMKSRLIKSAFETEVGKALMNSVIDNIYSKIASIVGMCTEGNAEIRVGKMEQLASEVHVAYNLLRQWAQILMEGEKHEKAMET